MYTTVTTLAALVASVLVSSAQGVAAQANPNTSPPATTTQTIGESNQKATVKKMNEDEKQKVETKGK
jgi:Spy/CpxP family protein refolding chaperone